ncbi:hypothetical protein ACFQVC_34765 [Streptomyces monticola]|uniref:Integral membrane protein n=1 Tax=Streptomyces monticola TaxID=2666263 RepID=A0ABW2JUQ5_9ACTN
MSLDDGTGVGGTGQTRTRLPEGDGGVYGGPRRPAARSPRSLITVVTVIVLLIAAIAFANRGDGGGSSTDDGNESGPNAAPTEASGKKAVSSGFAHDRQGAESAAANYAVALGSDDMFNAGTRHEILDSIYTRAAAAKLKKPMDKAYSPEFLARMGLDADGNPPKGSTFVSRTVPVGTKAVRHDADSATVSVWYTGLIGMSGTNSTDPVRTTWKTWTFELTWTGDDWKITKDSQKDGPAPVPGDEPAATSKDISEAVEQYGGFTYAR